MPGKWVILGALPFFKKKTGKREIEKNGKTGKRAKRGKKAGKRETEIFQFGLSLII
jgi:hypothetical protein